MKLTKNLTIALNAISYIRKAEKPVSASELSTVTGGTPFFVQRVMHQLGSAGIVKSVRGPGGGYVVEGDQVSAHKVAVAVGCSFPILTLNETPVETIERSIIESFVATRV